LVSFVEISAKSAARPRDVGQFVRDEPLTALAIATVAGFILGGGVNRTTGLAILTIVGRTALRSVAIGLIVGMVKGADDARRQNTIKDGGRKFDNGRTDFQEPE
jgi:hypothetical protein